MDNISQLEALSKNFTREALSDFLFRASGSFRREKEDLSWQIETAPSISDLAKLGQIDFGDGQRLVVLAGQVEKELTSQSGKQKQYEIAKKVLKQHFYDAGIFVFHDSAGHFRFSLITAQYKGEGSGREFSSSRRYTYFVSPEQSARTFIEYIGKADFSSIEKILAAFSVEPVTKEFFKEYRKIFEEAEATITLDWNDEKKRLYTQRFFNRMMFIAFLERKGWLRFDASLGRKDYLHALFADYHLHQADKRTANFHKSRLNTLFFRGLNNPHGDKLQSDPQYKMFRDLIGDVPYLNGGLFDEEPEDIDGPLFPDAVVAKILSDLVYKFNFTVTESTPLDIEVAVDPEMLGRIFEELVTGRHESGSYYTPKPVVAFMCREALKGYLGTALPSESDAALARFVDQNNPEDLRNPELTLNALKAVKVCDPACGSGAYLLGMLHELLEQRECLFAAHLVNPIGIYKSKLEIIQNNLYGVDLDPFAVNIARLRLWLSLIVDYEGDNPPPLPNLDFKIEPGDSLTAPDPLGELTPDLLRYSKIQEFLRLKNDFQNLHEGQIKKQELSTRIKNIRAEIAVGMHTKKVVGFDWAVEFAEVFQPELAQATLNGKMAGIINSVDGQMELTETAKPGGFDIVLANPPYVRQELLGVYKEQLLKLVYPEVYSGMADLYVYFYARAHQLLRNGGVACFISSNKWLRAGYGEKLREHLLDKQAFSLVVDFGELPVFQTAATFPAIFLWQKQARGNTQTKWATVKDLQSCYDEGLQPHIDRISEHLPASQFGVGKSRLASYSVSSTIEKMQKSGPTLNTLVQGEIYRGITTGLNIAYIIDAAARKEFITMEPQSSELIKHILGGDELRRYEVHWRERYMIWVPWSLNIEKYPQIHKHLQKYKKDLDVRADAAAGRHPWFAMSRYAADYYQVFEKPKIMSSKLASEPRFVMENTGFYLLNTTYCIATDDWYLLGVLNSKVLDDYLRKILVIMGDPDAGGRPEPRTEDLLSCPIPDAPQAERDTVANLAEHAQNLHSQRRARVEQFLREIGIDPAQSTSRNPLEAPWSLSAEEFTRRTRNAQFIPNYEAAREETSALTGAIGKVEAEIDERVKSLYGV